MKKIIFALLSLVLLNAVKAQQYSLYNTRTLFDSFENPSQKAFQPDSSRQFAFNLFIPAFGFNGAIGGPVKSTLKNILFHDSLAAAGLTLGEHQKSRAFMNMNTYILMFKLYKSVRDGDDRELGLSWQVRSDGQASITNETIAIFDNYRLFPQTQLSDAFNDKGYIQNYHQISFTYRKNYDKLTGIGLKLSYLSGIAYNDLKVNKTTLSIDTAANLFDIYLNGRVRTNFLYDDTIGTKFFAPAFKNPGVGLSASMNFTFRKGWYVLANLKDVGFIKWNKKSYNYALDRDISISNASGSDSDERLADELDFHSAYTQRGFITPTNGKAEILVNKNLGFYQPNLLVSKNLFHNGGDLALMNNFNHKQLNFSFSTAYNTIGTLQFGSQFMIKSPNTEFYIGSDQLYKTVHEIKGLAKDDETYFRGYPGASFYFGFSTKFGYIIESVGGANRVQRFNYGNRFIDRILRKLGILL
jgi:hypothetical protein